MLLSLGPIVTSGSAVGFENNESNESNVGIQVLAHKFLFWRDASSL
jgi:hypothetical protein